MDIPTRTVTVDGRSAKVRPVPWRLFRQLSAAEGNEAQLDAMEGIVARCAEVDGLDPSAIFDELSRDAVEALFRAAVDSGDPGADAGASGSFS